MGAFCIVFIAKFIKSLLLFLYICCKGVLLSLLSVFYAFFHGGHFAEGLPALPVCQDAIFFSF
jgi:hypothetical protein